VFIQEAMELLRKQKVKTMKVTYTKADLLDPAKATILAGIINDTKHGGFMTVHALVPKTGYGEISDYTFCKGISYENAVKTSLKILAKLENDPTFSIRVTRGTWQDGQGNESPTGKKSKAFPVPVTVSQTYMAGDAATKEAFAKIRKSLEAPAAPTKEYVSLGNGIYKDENDTLFLRDLRLVSKRVIQHGTYPFSASGEIVALADAIKKVMPVGNYRQFRLDQDYDSISMGGIELEQETPEEKEGMGLAKKIQALVKEIMPV